MIGRLNHVAIAVGDIAKASEALPRHARRGGVRRGAAAGPRREHGVHHAAEHQDRAARAARRELADREIPRAQSGRRHPPHLLRGRRHPRGARQAESRRARACSATAIRRSARTASRCCSCTRRISAARWWRSSRRRWPWPGPPRLAIYFIIWWVVLFAVLPFGVRNREPRKARRLRRGTIRARRPISGAGQEADLDHAGRVGAVRDLLGGLCLPAGDARRSRRRCGGC